MNNRSKRRSQGLRLLLIAITSITAFAIWESNSVLLLLSVNSGSRQLAPSFCQRSCPFRRNKIVLDHYGYNGLSDRESILRVMTNMAGYLCATVYAPPPGTMLAVSHNGNKPVSMKLTWRDFYTITFRQDNMTALRQYQKNIVNWDQPFNIEEVFRQSQYNDWLRVTTKDPNEIIQHFQQLETFVEWQQDSSSSLHTKYEVVGNSRDTNTGFIWEVYSNHYDWRGQMAEWFRQEHPNDTSLPGLWGTEEGCSYTRHLPSAVANEIVNRVFHLVRDKVLKTDSYGLFHIRRGDSVTTCDTSLEKIYTYLTCSLSPPDVSRNFGRVTLLLASDERDPCYRKAIEHMIESLGLGFVDLDETILTVVQDYSKEISNGSRLLGNMFVYYISRLIANDPRIDLVLEQRRHINCSNCTNVFAKHDRTDKTLLTMSKDRSALPVMSVNLAPLMQTYKMCLEASTTNQCR